MIPAHLNDPPKTLLEHQALFAYLFCAELVPFAYSQGLILVPVEMGVQGVRKVRIEGRTWGNAEDAVHIPGSTHYARTAADVNVYMREHGGDWQWISDGGNPVWTMLGQKWKSLHPKCVWGGDFPKVDANHFSVMYGGVK